MSNCGMIYGSLGMVEVVHVASSTVAYRPTLTHSLSTTFTARSKYVLKQMSIFLALGVLDEFSVHALGYCESDVGLLWICD